MTSPAGRVKLGRRLFRDQDSAGIDTEHHGSRGNGVMWRCIILLHAGMN
jgi:hypothetical protein